MFAEYAASDHDSEDSNAESFYANRCAAKLKQGFRVEVAVSCADAFNGHHSGSLKARAWAAGNARQMLG